MRDQENDFVDVGEMHIQKHIARAKDRMQNSRAMFEETMRSSKPLLFAGNTTAAASQSSWFDATQRRRREGLEGRPKFIGHKANELTKYMSSENITRHREEMNLAVPTLRQVLKVDDGIDMKQMTKSQLCAFSFDPTQSAEHRLRRLPEVQKLRHEKSYRAQLR